MTGIQVSLFQLDNYGPWTVTPEPRPEPDLQALQARLYADVAAMIGSRSGYVFYTRFDNMVAVTNGLELDDHRLLQESVGNRYPVTISLGVATGRTPVQALEDATGVLQAAGSAQDQSRREILEGRVIEAPHRTPSDVEIAHFDVNDATGRYTDELNAFDSFIEIEQGYAALMAHLRREFDSLAFFVGGDNIIATTPGLEAADYTEAIRHVEDRTEIALKVGVGRGATAHAAGMAAKHALERCRATGDRVEIDGAR